MKEIYITDEVKMYRSDERNIILEQLTEGINPKSRELVKSWKIIGYFRTFTKALEHVVNRDLLVDEKQVNDLESYLNELRTVRAEIEKFVREY